jgi:glucose/arabinose dehydrogenase
MHSFTLGLDGRPMDLGFAQPGPLSGTFGRLRTVVQGPDDSLYIATSNGGGQDVILRVTPSGGRCAASS